jgi:hypothetical protein
MRKSALFSICGSAVPRLYRDAGAGLRRLRDTIALRSVEMRSPTVDQRLAKSLSCRHAQAEPDPAGARSGNATLPSIVPRAGMQNSGIPPVIPATSPAVQLPRVCVW